MLKALIRSQWKGSWHLVTALTIAAVALPITSVRVGWKGADSNLPRFLGELQLWGLFYPGLALVAAIAIAAALWASDRRGHHVYAMLLPISRRRYVLLRYCTGLVILLPVILGMWAGSLLATVMVDLPPGLRVFPNALALKFALTLVLFFGFTFGIAAASSRTLGIAVRLVGLFLAVHIGVIMVHPETNLIWKVVSALATWPGPLAPLGGRWMLIDV